MQNKVTVIIDGQEYNLVASAIDAAILAALNMADEHLKGLDAQENLRVQIKESLEENKKLNLELSEAKREIFRLQTQGRKN